MSNNYVFYSDSECLKFIARLNEEFKRNLKNTALLVKKGFLFFDYFEDDKQAIPPLEKALELEPDNVDALFWLAKIDYHLVGDDLKEISLLEKALKIDPNRADCHDLLTEIYSENLSRNFSKVKYHSRMVIRLEPSWPGPRMRFIGRLMNRFEFAEAKKVAEDGLNLCEFLELPQDADEIAVYFEDHITGRTEYSRQDFEKVLEKIGEIPEGYLSRFCVFVIALFVALLTIILYKFL
ncbi:tetratricopeptide repeat protein [Candidatus Dependentiae bacterium]